MKLTSILNENANETTTSKHKKGDVYIYKIQGLFSSINKRNVNGRLYPMDIMQREITSLKERIANGTVLGELEHPESTIISYENAVIKLDGTNLEGEEVIGKASVIPKGKGIIIEGLIDVGAKIGISSRAVGSLDSDKVVQDDYELITYDIVSEPSNYNSYLNAIEESKNKFIVETNGNLVAYNRLKENISKYTPSSKEEVLFTAVKNFLESI